ncbi:MAG: hypothetical protein RLZZ450_2281 [Pseudomonadota bacterium]
MTNKLGLVSVVIPAFNARQTIREAVESVLAQTYSDLEVVVVDDCSTDGTLEILADLAERDGRLRLLRRSENGGPPATRNTGIRASSGALLAFIDADDLWHPEKIAMQVEKMAQCGPEVGVVYTWCTYMDEAGHIIPNRVFAGKHEGDVYAALLFGNFINNTWLVRRSCLEAIGGYSEHLAIGNEDLQIYLDLAERYEFVVVPEFLTAYRVLQTSKSHDVWRMKDGHEAVRDLARERHPSLPGWLFRWSASNQLWFLAFRCAQAGEWTDALKLGLLTIARDPEFVLRPVLWRALLRYVPRLLGRAPVMEPEPVETRPFLDGGPPPKLARAEEVTVDEQRRARRIAGLTVHRFKAKARPEAIHGERDAVGEPRSRAV